MKHASVICAIAGHKIERERMPGYWRTWCSRCGHEFPIQVEDDATRAYGAPRDVPRGMRC